MIDQMGLNKVNELISHPEVPAGQWCLLSGGILHIGTSVDDVRGYEELTGLKATESPVTECRCYPYWVRPR